MTDHSNLECTDCITESHKVSLLMIQLTDALSRIENILERVVVVEERSKHTFEDIKDFDKRLSDVEKLAVQLASKIEFIYLISGTLIGLISVGASILYEILK